jgi:acetyl esterase/lipase
MNIRTKITKSIIHFVIAHRKEESILEQRARLENLTRWARLPKDVAVKSVQVNEIPSEWIVPSNARDDQVILYLHGGGYVVGSVNTHRDLISRVSRAAKMQTLAINYRLAPEHPFPAALEDATQAYRWLLTSGFDPAKIIFAGDSAGGGLTLVTLITLRDSGEPLPAGAVCLSPWTDLAGTGESMKTKAEKDVILQKIKTQQMARAYTGIHDLKHPLISPLYADLRGLPPLLIQVGMDEILLDDSTRLAEKARAAGVDVTLEIWDDMDHVFQAQAIILPEARRAITEISRFMQKIILAEQS